MEDIRKSMISIPILSEILNVSEKELKRFYGVSIVNNCVPFDTIPYEVIEKYLKEYVHRENYIDVDLMKLFDQDSQKECSILYSKKIQEFFKNVELTKETQQVIDLYKGTGLLTEKLKVIANQHHMSYRTLIRRRKQIMNHTVLSKLIKEDKDYSYRSCCDLARDYVIYRTYTSGIPTGTKIFDELKEMDMMYCCDCPYKECCKREREKILIPNNVDTVWLIQKRISKQELCLVRKGYRYWENKYQFTFERKHTNITNKIWYADHHKLDIFVKTKQNRDGTWESKRVWLTGILDAATGALVAYALSLNPNSTTIAQVFARACMPKVDCPYIGTCQYLYIDNGKDYQSKSLKGISHSDKPLFLNKEFGESGLLEWLNIKQVSALYYHGRSKAPIERAWETIEERWISDLPGYCGNCIENRPFHLEKDRKEGKLYTFGQFADYFADVIYPAFNSFSKSGKTPNELYMELDKYEGFIPSWKSLMVLCSKIEKRKVHQNGIHFDHKKYWCSELEKYIGETVNIHFFDAPFHRFIGVSVQNKSLGIAQVIENLDIIEENREKVMQYCATQRKQSIYYSQHIEQIYEIIDKSRILDKTLKIPVIDMFDEKLSYVQKVIEQEKVDTIPSDFKKCINKKESKLDYQTSQLLSSYYGGL